MLRQKLKKLVPNLQQLKQYKSIMIFKSLLLDPKLWHFHRHNVARAFSVGLFIAWIPVPFQMLLAAGTAIIVRCNLPIAVALVWVTNPITMPPLFYLAYKIGQWILNTPPQDYDFNNVWESIAMIFTNNAKPFLLGSLICAIASSIIGNIFIRLFWRYHIVKALKERQNKRQNKTKP